MKVNKRLDCFDTQCLAMTWTCLFYAADKSGITLNHAGKIEVAFSKPSINTIIRIAETLKISVSELCDFSK